MTHQTMTDNKPLPDRTALLEQVNALLHKETFSKEDSSRVDLLLRLADAIEASDMARGLKAAVMAIVRTLTRDTDDDVPVDCLDRAEMAGKYFDQFYNRNRKEKNHEQPR
jgi:hypothetical protein